MSHGTGPAAVLPLHVMDGGEKSLTPVVLDGGDWETSGGYRSKHRGGYGAQPGSALGVLRNDRTPLNTPYTPQLVKLHLERHDEYEQQQLGDAHYEPRAPTQLATALRAKLAVLALPVQRIRSVVDRTVELVLPDAVLQSRLFANHRKWVVWYLTAVVSVPLAMLLSPMLIALCICTSPIWTAALVVAIVRAVVAAWHHPPLAPSYVRKTSPHNSHHLRQRHHHHNSDDESHSHPNSVYRHAQITPHDTDQDQDG